MMPLRRRVCFFPIWSYMRPKFTVNGHSTLTNNLKLPSAEITPKKNNQDLAQKIKPVTVKPDPNIVEVGEELVGDLSKTDISSIISTFYNRSELDKAASENGLEKGMYDYVKNSFKQYCLDSKNLSSELHIIFCDIVNGYGHVLDLLPYFLQYALLVYPHLKYKDELLMIGDLTSPEIWFSKARSTARKLFFHYGPTNSGKTYKALERFYEAKTGIYCAPLKLLANEIYDKANKRGVPCDLVTGEEIKRASSDGSHGSHISCTVEMASVNSSYDVAVIDEIQMIKDINRGYAWTRALLGIAANEMHLCGEAGALQYIQEVAERLGENIECIKYKRLTQLFFENRAVENFKNIQDGDCIICFSKKEIFQVMKALEKLEIDFAVVYGTLPPGTKLHQCSTFNDPKNKCNVLVATDAVGLGLNLNIRRIVFYNLEKWSEVIPVSLALQIAGRAGRFQSRYEKGFVAAFKTKDVKVLKELMLSNPEPVTKAGLFPTVEQIETFSYYLPDLSFSELIDVFSALCVLNEKYFMCDLTGFKQLAKLIQHINLSIKSIYTFCSAPINYNSLICQTLFVKFAKKYSLNEVITVAFMKKFLNWPLKKPLSVSDLVLLEEAFDCLDLYLWFGIRFPVLFPDCDSVRVLREQLDCTVLEGMRDVRLAIKRAEEGEVPLKTEDNVIEKEISPILLAKLKKEWLKEMKKKKDIKNQQERTD